MLNITHAEIEDIKEHLSRNWNGGGRMVNTIAILDDYEKLRFEMEALEEELAYFRNPPTKFI